MIKTKRDLYEVLTKDGKFTIEFLIYIIMVCYSRKSLVARFQILPSEFPLEHSSRKEKSLESRRNQILDFPDDDL